MMMMMMMIIIIIIIIIISSSSIVSMSMSRLPLTLELLKELSTGTFDLFLHFFVILGIFIFSVT